MTQPHPLRNRVTPFGEIIAIEARGMLFGNRGLLHNDDGVLIRPWQVKRWIACRLEFKGRRRQLLQPGRFTELFFLDEATALAAGHRPCAECRREDFLTFREKWGRAHLEHGLKVDDIDRVLHEERVGPGRAKRLHEARIDELPEGSMVVNDGQAWVVLGNELLRWTPFGYHERRRRPAGRKVELLTPPSMVAAIEAGYEVAIHPSATRVGRAHR